MLQAGSKRRRTATNDLAEDERLFEKREFVFTKVWGIDPTSGVSVNALTENATVAKHDPLYNGISLDLVNEKPGGVSSEISFGENALFKLESFQAPTLMAQAIESDPNFAVMSDGDYANLKRMHALHEANKYELAVYEDERYDVLTFPNYSFSRQSNGLHFKTTTFATSAVATPWWWQWMDQRVLFQVSPRLISSDKAYDSIAFHQSSMQEASRRKTTGKNRNKTVYSKNSMPLKPFTHVYPCKKSASNGQIKWR